MQIDKLVVVGAGLIGASCALALRAAGAVREVVGVGRTRANLDAAVASGAIDRAHTLADGWTHELRDAGVVLIAAPVGQYADLLAALAPHVHDALVVTDAGSTKADVAALARSILGARLPRFVPGHPIAGSDKSGAAAASPTLFRQRSVVLTPLAETAHDATATVRAMWSACGAEVREMAPDAHDRVFAAVSHLPHVVAFAFVADLVARDDGAALLQSAGSGFRDFTRIAASSPEMWRDIALSNRDALRDEIARLVAALRAVDADLAAGNGAALASTFSRAAAARQRFDVSRATGDDGE